MSNYIERYWRDAKPEDAIKEPPMVARFRDKSTLQWSDVQELRGWVRRRTHGWLGDSGAWAQCQVYDAPDPGDGWRLIDPDKDNYMQDGIEYREAWQSNWNKRDELSWTPFSPKTFYRIRIAPTVTYVPFTWEDREQLRGRWIGRDSIELQVTDVRNENGLYINRIDTDSLCQYWKFLDTGKPVGKEVTQ